MSKLKQKLKNHQLTIGSWLMTGNMDAAEILAGAGFDWLTIDIEHTSTDWQQLRSLVTAITNKGKEALVRVGANDELIIKRAMDCGATGVIVPMIKSRAEAEKAVSFVKYPPHGKRGVGLYKAQDFGFAFKEYCQWVKENSVVIAQIEHIEAVKNIDQILETPELDGIIIGPYDLSASMGFPGEYEREDVKAALEKVRLACEKAKLPMGAHVVEPEAEKIAEKVKSGYKFLAFSIDTLFLGHMARQQLNKVKELVGNTL